MSFHEKQRIFANKFNHKINQISSPLIDNLGVSQFYYFRVTNSGHFLNMGIHQPFIEYYYSQPSHLTFTPFFRHPKYFQNGISSLKAIKHEGFQHILDCGRKDYDVNLSLHVTKKTENGYDGYGFGLNSADQNQQIALFNALPFLRLYIKKFEELLAPHATFLEDHLINIAEMIGPQFYEPPGPLNIPSLPYEPFLKQMGLQPLTPLTSREYDVIKHLLEGSPASLIAEHLNLSRRTIEHYIENIKSKFNCTTKADLLKILFKLESIGYLDLQ